MRDGCGWMRCEGPSARLAPKARYTLIVTALGHFRMPSNLELGLYVFMLATFVGLEVIRRVSPLLHTPLMSLTNAISAISVVGAILIISNDEATTMSKVLGFIAITAATTNIVSGFLITDRMLKMFKRREEKK
jgi:NAD(P) transhydrogenase subunit alpha